MSQQQQNDEKRNLLDYCESFSTLKVNTSRKRGDAPYKPILLLSVIDLVAQGKIQQNRIEISDELIEIFNKYWDLISSGSFNGGLALPFFHLKNEKNKFWYLKYSSQYDGGRPQTIPKLREDVDYAYLDKELFEFLQHESSRKDLIDTLVAAWFSFSKREIEDLLRVNQEFQDFDNEKKPQFNFNKSIVRNAFFRKTVVHIYNYKCSFCGLKVTKALTQNIVDGAHIKPLAKFYDNRINNGIAFCKNHHWAFDNGLFGIDDNYRIVVAKEFQEESPNSKSLKEFNGETIILPDTENFFPSIEALNWHRQNILKSYR